MKSNALKKVIIGLAVSMILLSSSVLATTGYYTFNLTRGGSSVTTPDAIEKTSADDYSPWGVTTNSWSFTGLPTNIWGSNTIYYRLKTQGGSSASDLLTFTSAGTAFQDIWDGYGALGAYYKLASSMPGSSSSSSSSIAVQWNP